MTSYSKNSLALYNKLTADVQLTENEKIVRTHIYKF